MRIRAGRRDGRRCGRALGLRSGRLVGRRQPDGEFHRRSRPFAPDGGGAAVQLGEPLDQHQPDPLDDVGRVARRGEVERPGERRGRDIFALIADAEHDGLLLPRDGDPDASARVGGPGGVSEQADEDLLQPRRIRVERQPARRRGERELLVTLVDQRANRRHGGAGGRGGVQTLPPQLDPPAGDAREVQQVVELPHQVLELTLHGVLGPGDVLRRGRPSRQVQGTADGGHRVAQVVRRAGRGTRPCGAIPPRVPPRCPPVRYRPQRPRARRGSRGWPPAAARLHPAGAAPRSPRPGTPPLPRRPAMA